MNQMFTKPVTFTLRPARLEDLEQAVPMFNRCSQRVTGTDEFSMEEYVTEWTSPSANLEEDMRVATTADGRIIGVVELWNAMPPYVLNWTWARVDPEFEGMGIGTRLMEWAEQRAREKIALAEPDTRIVMRSGADARNRVANALFEALGFDAVRYSYTMEIEHTEFPPAPDAVAGITIRSISAPDEYEEVHRLDVEAFRDHWGTVQRPFDQSFRDLMHFVSTGGKHDPALWFVAMDGERMAGISLCTLKANGEPTAGFVDTLAVRKAYRHRGIGLALLQHSFRELYARGQRKVHLGVDAFNLTGALRLYERAGMHVIKQFDLYEKELRAGRDLITS